MGQSAKDLSDNAKQTYKLILICLDNEKKDEKSILRFSSISKLLHS